MPNAIKVRQRLAMDKPAQVIEEGDLRPYREPARELLKSAEPVALLAAALKLLIREPDTIPVNLTAEAPLGRKRERFPERSGRSGFTRAPGAGAGRGRANRKGPNIKSTLLVSVIL